MSNIQLVYSGTPIGERDEMLSLTDMWRAAGGDPSKRPAKWREILSVQEFIEHIASSIRVADSELFAVAIGGANPATWAHWQIGMAYAKYLSPEFHAWCNEKVRAHMERRTLPVQAIEGAVMLSPAGLDRLADKIGEGAVRAAHGFIAQTITPRFDRVEQRLDFLEKNTRRRRRPTDRTKAQLISDIADLGGNCPCCQRCKVVIDGQKTEDAQFDHYEDVGDNSETALWLICKSCHLGFKPRGSISRSERRPVFDAFQLLRAELPGRQLRLIA